MDQRLPLRAGTVLEFDAMPCHIEEVVGCGSNAIVYKGWYCDRLCPEQRHHVLIKELFPFHPAKKIWRDEQGQIVVEEDARQVWEAHRQSFLAGNEIHLHLLADHPDLLGANLNSYCLGGTLYSVLGYSGGRDLYTELTRPGLNLGRVARWMLLLLDALEAFHESGYLHMDISPDNMMLVGNGEDCRVFLIDYNSARPVGADSMDYLSIKDGYSAPEAETKSMSSIGFATDLYSVAAVFFRCLMGRKLTLEERLRAKAPSGSDSPLLQDAPQTVSSMVGQILKKGLNILPGKRYQSIGQMRLAFRELLDRIDCVGVTHWALWESGRRSVEELIRLNPSLRYLKEEQGLYPIRLEGDGSMSLPEYLEALLSPGGSSGLILAQGGMGKTTLLLHTALLQGKRYSAGACAVFYISLNGWSGADSQYIAAQILRGLRFKRENNTFDSAMHALHQLLGQTLKTKSGELPMVLLLLDGLNEIQGDLRPLIQEINALSAMAGVRILAASRTQLPELKLTPLRLTPLTAEDVEDALGKRGLLMPQSPEVLPLLRTPLILSIFIQASQAGKQLDIHNEKELMKAYMDALYQKELQGLPENTPVRWQLDAALNLVLPCIAAAQEQAGHPLTDGELLHAVEKCWKALHAPSLRRVFPQWIGHSRDIFGAAKNPEEWYGILIHQLLWQRLGLLLREPQGGYRVFHQEIGSFLAEEYRPLARQLRKRKALRLGVITCAAALLLTLGVMVYRELTLYDDKEVQKAIDWGTLAYVSYGLEYKQLRQMTDEALEGDLEQFVESYRSAANAVYTGAAPTRAEQLYRLYVETYLLPDSGKKVSWSGLPFDGALTLELLDYPASRMSYYLELLPSIGFWMSSQQVQARFPDYINLFSQVLEADANVASELYHQTCAVHLTNTGLAWERSIRDDVAMISEQEDHRQLSSLEDRPQYLENLLQKRDDAQQELLGPWTTINAIYASQEGTQ
ncbi:MAG: hypothetical protein ACI3XG_00275 [Faecousia sp.]